MFLHYLNKHLFPIANDEFIKIHNLHQKVTIVSCSGKDMKREYTNALAHTHTQSICTKKKKNPKKL